MSSDKEKIYYELLAIRCRRNDTKALEELIHLFETRLFYYLRRLVDEEEDAWDLLQETWMKVIKSIHQLKEPRKLPVWLYSIARNTAMSHLRKTISYGNLLKEHDLNTPDENNQISFDWVDPEKIHKALQQISLPHREALTLFFLEEFTIEEIGNLLEIPNGTVKSRIYHAKQEMRKILEKEGITHAG